MQKIVDCLGSQLEVSWQPDETRVVHGEIKQNKLCIFNRNESDALATLTHEIIEFKLKELTRVYRILINNLIDSYEKLAYQKKKSL